MSRGIEVHDGYISMPENVIPKLHMGTVASPMTQIEAGQIVVSAVINALALGGAVKAGEFIVVASVSLTGDPIALRARAVVNDAIALTGSLTGIKVETDILGTGTVSDIVAGIYIAQYAPATATITTTLFGIFITNYMQVSPTSYSFIRCSENGGATLTSCLLFTLGGGATPSDATWFMQLQGANKTCWSTVLDKSVGAHSGYLRIQVHGAERYIQLYEP